MTTPGAPSRHLSFLIPGDWSTPTGGFRYDRRMAQALAASGWSVDAKRLDARWPVPDDAALALAEDAVAAIPDGRTVLADGLAYGVLGRTVAAHARRLRWVALVHHPLHLETGLDPALRQRLRQQESEALGFARQVIVTSARTLHDVVALGVPPARIAIVEPGTEPAYGGPIAAEPAAEPAAAPASAHASAHAPALGAAPGAAGRAVVAAPGPPVQLLCVATVTPRKGHALLLQALAGLRGLHWQLHCVGSLERDAATAAQVQALTTALGLAPQVNWHGEVDEAAMQGHYAAADLLVLASLHEGYGMVVAEALAAGLPVLASDAGALADTLPPEAGLRVPPGEVPALQAALQRLIDEPALRARLAAGARAAGLRLPGWPAQAARLAAVLEALPGLPGLPALPALPTLPTLP